MEVRVRGCLGNSGAEALCAPTRGGLFVCASSFFLGYGACFVAVQLERDMIDKIMLWKLTDRMAENVFYLLVIRLGLGIEVWGNRFETENSLRDILRSARSGAGSNACLRLRGIGE